MTTYRRNEIVTGDARALAASIPDTSVDLVFTDPVYDRIEDYAWLAETAARVLKPGGALLAWCGIGYLPETLDALRAGGMRYRWQGIWYISNGMKRADMGFANYSCFIWADKSGDSRPVTPVGDISAIAIPDPGNARKHQRHHWEKQPAVIARYAHAFTLPGALVYDPFAGGGTVPAVCKMLGRDFLASEIDPATAERARERLAATTPPLPGIYAEQAALDLEAA